MRIANFECKTINFESKNILTSCPLLCTCLEPINCTSKYLSRLRLLWFQKHSWGISLAKCLLTKRQLALVSIFWAPAYVLGYFESRQETGMLLCLHNKAVSQRRWLGLVSINQVLRTKKEAPFSRGIVAIYSPSICQENTTFILGKWVLSSMFGTMTCFGSTNKINKWWTGVRKVNHYCATTADISH